MGVADFFPYDTSTIPPPPGVKANFSSPKTRGNIIIIMGALLLALVFVFIAVRFYIKVIIVKSQNWGDFLCLLGTVGCIAYYISLIISVVKGSMGKHLWDIRLVEAAGSTGSTLSITTGLATAIFLSPTLLVTKLAIFMLYFELFHHFDWMRRSLYVGMAITIPFYVAYTVAFIYFAIPKKGETWETHGFSKDAQKIQDIYVPHRIVGFIIDLYLLVLPLKAIIDLHLPTKRKLEVLVVFLTGALATITSSLSIYYATIQVANADLTWNAAATQITAIIEVDVAVIIACMPAMSKFLHYHMPTLHSARSIFSLSSNNIFNRSGYKQDDRRHVYSNQRLGSTEGSGIRQYHTVEISEEVEIGPPSSLRKCYLRADGSRAVYELNHLQSVSTYINSGTVSRNHSNDHIHLKQEIWQS